MSTDLGRFTEALGKCREEFNMDERIACETDIIDEFSDEVERMGLLSEGSGRLRREEALGMLKGLDKTGQGFDDVEGVFDLAPGVWSVSTDNGKFIVKRDNPTDIVLTKQARNVTDVIEDDSTTVLHQDLNKGVMVLSDEGFNPSRADIDGMEAGFAVVTESVMNDNDRKEANMGLENHTLSEIDFESGLQDSWSPDSIEGLTWQMNKEVADKVATVLQCGGWKEAFEASASDGCVESSVSREFRNGIKAGVKNFNEFKETDRAPDFDEFAPLVPSGAGERVSVVEEFAFGSGDLDYNETDLDAR